MPWPCFIIVEHEPRVEQIVLHGHYNDPSDPLHRTVIHKFVGMDFDDHPPMDELDWPEVCPVEGCEHRFGDDDGLNWRTLMGTRSWRRPDTGEIKDHQHEFGPGAMFDATWWNEWWAERTPDGKVWGVVLPPGGQSDIWIIDGEASSGGFWTRTGTPPQLSVTPSILTPNYHGFLQDGVLTDSLSDRPL